MIKNKRGFTLIEILIALFIFVIISMIVANGLFVILKTQSVSNEHAQQLADLQISLTKIQRDFSQTIGRSIIDNRGIRRASVIVKTNPVNSIEFTRAGFVNPLAKEKRSTLQRVAYYIKDNQLIRETWLVLDRQANSGSIQQVIISQVTSFSLRVLDNKNKFIDHWPNYNQAKIILPRAIELTFCLSKGCLTRLITLNGSTAHAQFPTR